MEENRVVLHNNGFPTFPPGYRFKPDDEQLIDFYLLPKVKKTPLPLNKISQVNIYKYNPHELAANYPHYEEKEKEWYFFSPRDRKYPKGTRPSRSAGCGYWKASGVDKLIESNGKIVGMKKTLVFYKKKTEVDNKDEKTDWIMHEYVLADDDSCATRAKGSTDMTLNDWVLCKIYERKPTSPKKGDDESLEEEENVDEAKPAKIIPPRPRKTRGRKRKVLSSIDAIVDDNKSSVTKSRGRKRKALRNSIQEEMNAIVEGYKIPIIESDQNAESLLSDKSSPSNEQWVPNNSFSTDMFQTQYPFPVSYYDFPSPYSPTAFNVVNDQVFKSQARYAEGFAMEQENSDAADSGNAYDSPFNVVNDQVFKSQARYAEGFAMEQENSDAADSGNAYDSFNYSVHLDGLPEINFPGACYPGFLSTGVDEGL